MGDLPVEAFRFQSTVFQRIHSEQLSCFPFVSVEQGRPPRLDHVRPKRAGERIHNRWP